MKKILSGAFLLSILVAQPAVAALFSLSGNHRFGSNWFYNLDLKDGKNLAPAKASDTAGFLEHRLLLRPDVIIDERFSLRSELSLIDQNGLNSATSPVNRTSVGAALDSQPPTPQALQLRYAYLKWNSDLGIFRAGRMPKGWGLGLLYDEGQDVEDDASTIVDRIGFEGQLGSLVLNFGFEKYEEGSLYQDIDDEDVYEGSVKYESETSGVSIGLLYARHARAADSKAHATPKPPSTTGLSGSNDVSFYAKKEWETLSLGIEGASVAYDNQNDVFGGLAQLRYNPGSWNLELDALYSSASTNRAFIVHPNYRPFLIMFRQNLQGNVGAASSGRYSNGVGYDPASTTNEENGALLGRLGVAYSFSQKKYKVGLVGGYAQLADENSKGEKILGFEADLNFDQQWYDNFKTSLTAGAFLPGKAFGPSPKMAFGMQIRSYLTF